ncbi:MAG: GH3 auxin-responsive promoter family protein [Flavobacteriales bacterium]|nr:GH3 auxin-responsive promoter family protein [Flavobacteriales bacterium]
MSLKSFLSKPFAKMVHLNTKNWSSKPFQTQEKVMRELIRGGMNTAFGKDHGFKSIKSYSDFKKNIPIRDYEQIKPYIQRVIDGESDVLWKGRPIYFCKTSGTTSGAKYIPITKDSISNHINCARNALLNYITETKRNQFVNGKMIFLQGNPSLEKTGDVLTGRLSGIVAHHVPKYLTKNRMPSFKTNCIDDWESKVEAIVKETVNEDMTLISGIPPWVQMYFEKLIEYTGKKTVREVFPNFSLMVHGGVNFKPYEKKFNELIGEPVDSIEVYPASEGFIGFQDSQDDKGLLLILQQGIFYEFVPVNEFHNENPTRVTLEDVEIGENYAIILNTNAGLWGYAIGDTVKFVSKDPYKIVVSGRVAHYTSAFGEHVIAQEVESAIMKACDAADASIVDFHVCPKVNAKEGNGYHEWFIEFSHEPKDLKLFAKELDDEMQNLNVYYKDLIEGNVLQPLKISVIERGGFINFMKSRGKLGGQNKTPRLANDRQHGDVLKNWLR